MCSRWIWPTCSARRREAPNRDPPAKPHSIARDRDARASPSPQLELGELDDIEVRTDPSATPAARSPAAGAASSSSRHGASRYIFCMQGLTYPASLVNLPTVIETHKAIDETEATFLKSADIGQMLIV